MNRTIKLAAVTAITALIAPFFVAQPAEANLKPYRWRHSTVCVEDHIHDGRWPGKSAVYRWDKVPDLRFVYRRDCSAYRQEIILRSRYEGYNGRYGRTYIRYNSSKYITRAVITMNDSYYGKYRMKYWSNRRSGIMHELGHASGLAHTSRYKSLMNIYHWHRWNYPTWYDKREVERRYPW